MKHDFQQSKPAIVKFFTQRLINLCLVNGLLLVTQCSAFAQVTPDNTLETPSSVNSNNVIQGGTRKGDNLFHSFQEFNIGVGQQVNFANPDGIQNIMSRVTGDNPSEIFGTLGVNGNANLFLLNPNGILFGENASLNLGGSFIASTASSINFNDGIEFSAANPQASSLLSISTPIGLQFGQNAGSIVNRSQAGSNIGFSEKPAGLQVQPGKTLALVGNGIKLEQGNLAAFSETEKGGSIEIGSVAESAFVGIVFTEQKPSLTYEDVENFADITLENSIFNVSGAGAGEMKLQAQNIILDRSTIESFSSKSGGSDNITINASKLFLQNISAISLGTNGEGKGGNLVANISDSVELSNTSFFLSITFASGASGNVDLNTKNLILRNGGRISGSTFGDGSGGNININAEKVEILGKIANSEVPSGESASGLFSETLGRELIARKSGLAVGKAGDIEINTDSLIIRDGGRISVGSVEDSLGQAGNIAINASDFIEISDLGSTILAESGSAESAGNLKLDTSRLTVQNGAEINVSALGTGAAGNLSISADTLNLDRGILTATTTVGNEGNITLNTGNIFLDRQSRIITDAQSSTGGNIAIDTDNLVAFNNSDITANAQQGTGGKVTVDAEGVFGIEAREQLTPFSDITASSELGTEFSGEVILRTPAVDPTSGVFELPDVPVDAESLFARDPCAFEEERIAGGSSFTITGRGGLPPTVEDPLLNSNRIVNWASSEQVSSDGSVVLLEDRATKTVDETESIEQAQGWVMGEDGEVYLTANAPQVTPALNHPSCRVSR